jgi:hypothetical protein
MATEKTCARDIQLNVRTGHTLAGGASPTTSVTYHRVLGRKRLTKNKIPFDAAMTLH